MEWIIIAIFGLFVADSNGAFDKEPEPIPVVEVITGPQYIVEQKPTYKADHYYKDEKNGYYISDLSSKPDGLAQQ